VTLLVLDSVTMRYKRGTTGARERVPVREVSLEIDDGELVALIGHGRTGRSTVLRLAAGIERPTEGTVRFDGDDLSCNRFLGQPGGIGYAHRRFHRVIARTVVGHVAAPLLLRGEAPDRADARADDALARVGAAACAELDPDALDQDEVVRMMLARALVIQPRLLLVDDPADVQLEERDSILTLLHSIAREDGVAVFFTVGSTTGAAGVDRLLSIEDGTVRGKLRPARGTVHQLRKSGHR
jgi:predicted ABC-type transport system involved in lysophospholipase L1 biosynthesis ATPase subunit